MLQASQIQSAIADMIFNGDMAIAGLMMFFFVMAIVFAIAKNVLHSLLLGLPLILVFTSLGILSGDMTIILIIIIVLGLGITARNTMSRDGGN